LSNEATIPYTLSLRYEDEGEGSRILCHQEVESLKGFFKFADPVVLKLYSRDVRSNLEKAMTIWSPDLSRDVRARRRDYSGGAGGPGWSGPPGPDGSGSGVGPGSGSVNGSGGMSGSIGTGRSGSGTTGSGSTGGAVNVAWRMVMPPEVVPSA
jgi:hypothetical protein